MKREVMLTCAVTGDAFRVGLEDNLYLERGVFGTNGQLVERAARLIEDLGETVATPAQMRDMLGLTRRGSVSHVA